VSFAAAGSFDGVCLPPVPLINPRAALKVEIHTPSTGFSSHESEKRNRLIGRRSRAEWMRQSARVQMINEAEGNKGQEKRDGQHRSCVQAMSNTHRHLPRRSVTRLSAERVDEVDRSHSPRDRRSNVTKMCSNSTSSWIFQQSLTCVRAFNFCASKLFSSWRKQPSSSILHFHRKPSSTRSRLRSTCRNVAK
jgi:hypothetical protein